MTAEEYQRERTPLLEEYESRVRAWLKDVSNFKELSEQIPFFRDGVVCPEVWFQEDNSFRPLFVLKEISLGINCVPELPQYLETWGYPKRFEFVENPFDDVRVGTFKQWQRIACLAKGMEQVHEGVNDRSYRELDFSFKPGGEEYSGDVEGYKTEKFQLRTANPVYNSIINRIAILEIKKVGAGQSVRSKLSLATKYYSRHIEPFEDLICRQIELMNPTVVVCLGRESGACISKLLENVKAMTADRPWIDGWHHSRSSNLHFFDEPIAEYEKLLRHRCRHIESGSILDAKPDEDEWEDI